MGKSFGCVFACAWGSAGDRAAFCTYNYNTLCFTVSTDILPPDKMAFLHSPALSASLNQTVSRRSSAACPAAPLPLPLPYERDISFILEGEPSSSESTYLLGFPEMCGYWLFLYSPFSLCLFPRKVFALSPLCVGWISWFSWYAKDIGHHFRVSPYL